MKLTKIIKSDKSAYIYNARETEIQSLTKDSRVTTNKGLFFCLEGNSLSGRDYVDEAVKKGAVAIVTEKVVKNISVPQIIVEDARKSYALFSSAFYGYPEKSLKIIAVVGTNGKTSVSRILYQALNSAGKRAAVIGSLGAEYEGKVYYEGMTTPDPEIFFKLLKDFKDSGAEYVITELSAHAVYLKKTEPIKYECTVFTNCTHDHLDYFGTFEKYKEVKKSAFSSSSRYFMVNSDDELGREIYAENAKKTLTYGLYHPSDVFAIEIQESLEGVKFVVNMFDMVYKVSSYLLGEYNVYNLLAACSVMFLCGIKPSDIVKYIGEVKPIRGRMEYVGEYRGGKIYVDYAHTPDGLNKSLSFLASTADGKTIVVFGAGGERDRLKRPLMGKIAVDIADFTIITSDNPRSEDVNKIIEEIKSGIKQTSAKYIIEPDRYLAIKKGTEYLTAGDVLLIAGKGAETTQELPKDTIYFSDKEAVMRAIGELTEENKRNAKF